MRYPYDNSIKEWYLEAMLEEIEKGESNSAYKLNLTYLKEVSEWEERFGKSVVDFTLGEITTMLRGLRLRSVASFHTVTSIIRSYVEFASAKLSKPVGQIQFVDTSKPEEFINPIAYNSRYTDREDLWTGLNRINVENPNFYTSMDDGVMDKLLVMLIFEGIRGKAFEELTNIRKKNIIRESKKIYIESSKSYIHIQDERVWELIDIALNRKEIMFISKDEREKEDIVKSDVNSDFLFLRISRKVGKPPEQHHEENYRVERLTDYHIKMSITRIMTTIEMPYLTGIPIYISGLAERVNDWLLTNNKGYQRHNVVDYLKMHNEKIGVNGLMQTLKHVYYS